MMPTGAVICLVLSGGLCLAALCGHGNRQDILAMALVELIGGAVIVLLDVFAPRFLGTVRPSFAEMLKGVEPQFYQGSQYWLGAGIVIMAVGAFLVVVSRWKER